VSLLTFCAEVLQLKTILGFRFLGYQWSKFAMVFSKYTYQRTGAVGNAGERHAFIVASRDTWFLP
jgi:hypothetical protein